MASGDRTVSTVIHSRIRPAIISTITTAKSQTAHELVHRLIRPMKLVSRPLRFRGAFASPGRRSVAVIIPLRRYSDDYRPVSQTHVCTQQMSAAPPSIGSGRGLSGAAGAFFDFHFGFACAPLSVHSREVYRP